MREGQLRDPAGSAVALICSRLQQLQLPLDAGEYPCDICSPQTHCNLPITQTLRCSYFRAAIRWQAAGRVSVQCWASALPVSAFTLTALRHSAGSRKRLTATVLLAVMVVARAAVLLRRLLSKLHAPQTARDSPSRSPSGLTARSLSWLRSRRRTAPAPAPQRQAAPVALLQAAVTDRLLLLDLVTTALMLLALVLLVACLIAEQRFDIRVLYSL